MQKLSIATVAASVLLLSSVSNAQAANLIQNGSFELGPDPGAYLPLNVGSTAIEGWTVIKGGIDYYGTGWVASDGNRSLDLNGTPGVGGVAQTFDTIVGQSYQVSFDMAGHNSGLFQWMKVAAAGKSADFFFQSSKDPNNLGWERFSWDFTAINPQTTLEFYSLQTFYEFGGPALDNVSVVAVSSITVPEPSSIVGLLAFGGLSAGSLLKRKKAAKL